MKYLLKKVGIYMKKSSLAFNNKQRLVICKLKITNN